MHTAFLTVNLTRTLKSGVALKLYSSPVRLLLPGGPVILKLSCGKLKESFKKVGPPSCNTCMKLYVFLFIHESGLEDKPGAFFRARTRPARQHEWQAVQCAFLPLCAASSASRGRMPASQRIRAPCGPCSIPARSRPPLRSSLPMSTLGLSGFCYA